MTGSKSGSEQRFGSLRLSGALAALIASALLLPLGAGLRTPLFDVWQRLAARNLDDSRIRVVLIDSESLQALGPWPWPRFYLAQLTRELTARGARAIGFDILFAEPDRTGPAAFASLYPELSANARAELATLETPDAQFARVIGESPVVLARAGTQQRQGNTAPSVEAELPDRLPDAFLRYPRAVTAIADLDDVALGHGLANAEPDPDGVYRQVPVLARIGNTVVPGLAAELARVATGAAGIELRGDHARIADHRIPLTSRGEMRLRFGRFPERHTISAVDLLRQGAELDLKDKVVLIGTAAEGTVDIVATPLEAKQYGVLVQAQALDAMLRGSGWLSRPRLAPAAEWGAALILTLLALWLLPRRGARQWLVPAAAAGVFGGAWLAFARGNLLLDPIPSITALAASALAMGFASLQKTRRERERLRETLVEERVAAAANEAELEAARSIQKAMLPRPEALASLDSRAQVAALLEPARFVGGDFYDLAPLSEDCIVFAIADVTGKGVPAALFMALSKTLAKSALLRLPLEEVADTLQTALSRDAPPEMGLTMLIGTLDLAVGTVRLVNAGHENPLLLRADGGVESIAMEGGPPFCITDYPWPVESLTLSPGDTLLLMTDGVSEAQDRDGGFFGLERVLDVLRAAPRDPQALVDHVLKTVRAFEGGTAPSDDLTLMAIRYQPS